MKKRLAKLTFREVFRNFNRFIAIFLIVALGTGFLAGLLATSPDMRETADNYYRSANFMDLRILSPMGFDENDVEAVRKTEGVLGAEAVYSVDTPANFAGTRITARIESLPGNLSEDDPNYINRLTLISGRMPENKDECVIEIHTNPTPEYELGCQIVIPKQADETSDKIFTVVGTVTSARYFSVEYERSTEGNGNISLFAYTVEEAFALDAKTDLFVRVTEAASLLAATDGYFDAVDSQIERMKPTEAERIAARTEEYKEKLTEKINEWRLELAEERAYAEKSFENEEQTFKDAVNKLNETSEVLKKERNGVNDLYAAYNNDYKKAQQDYIDARSSYEAREKEIADAILSLDRNAPDYAEKIAAFETETDEIEKTLKKLSDGYEETLKTLEARKNKIDAQSKTVAKKESAYLSEVRTQNEYYKVFLQNKAEILAGFAKEEKEIAKLEQTKETFASDGWIYLGRDMSVAAASFASNTEKIEAIAKIFPIFFFIVAVFVVMTTMTRMVNEQRGQIGILKSLGYSSSSVMWKYIIYSFTATVIGSAVGLAVGFRLFPSVIWNAYGILYNVPGFSTPFRYDIAVFTFLAMIITTSAATYIACRREVMTTATALMHPKTPKPGKGVFLEKIGFVWKRISFSGKVTVRNIFRYKKRLIMTVLGVAGSTALLLTGFGIRDSIGTLIKRQFSEIYKYNLTVNIDASGDYGDVSYAKVANILARDGIYKFIRTGNHSATAEKNGTEIEITTITPAVAKDLKYFTVVKNISDGKITDFEDGMVVVGQKLAEQLGIKAGDVFNVTDGEGTTAELTVSLIMENYVFYNVYIAPDVYEAAFGDRIETNTIIAAAYGDREFRNAIAEDLLSCDSVLSINYYDETAADFEESMKSIDGIAWVLIVSAGLLVFIVLYNLININLTERKKEVATIKVLGYNGYETFKYMAREIMIMSVFGIIVGLGFGVILHQFVIRTAELETIMFIRSISPASYSLSIVISLIFAFVINLIMYPKIRKTDMVESLKAGE